MMIGHIISLLSWAEKRPGQENNGLESGALTCSQWAMAISLKLKKNAQKHRDFSRDSPSATSPCHNSLDLHMHQVTSFKHWSPILPSATQTLGDILVYVVP